MLQITEPQFHEGNSPENLVTFLSGQHNRASASPLSRIFRSNFHHQFLFPSFTKLISNIEAKLSRFSKFYHQVAWYLSWESTRNIFWIHRNKECRWKLILAFPAQGTTKALAFGWVHSPMCKRRPTESAWEQSAKHEISKEVQWARRSMNLKHLNCSSPQSPFPRPLTRLLQILSVVLEGRTLHSCNQLL